MPVRDLVRYIKDRSKHNNQFLDQITTNANYKFNWVTGCAIDYKHSKMAPASQNNPDFFSPSELLQEQLTD